MRGTFGQGVLWVASSWLLIPANANNLLDSLEESKNRGIVWKDELEFLGKSSVLV